MSNSKSKQAKPKTGLARCMELASDRKGLVFLAAVLSSLAAIASFIPYIAVYFMIRSIIDVYKRQGSNAKLLSGELATYLGGRYVEFVIYPFSFGEFMELYRSIAPDASIQQCFQKYLLAGGMPYLANLRYADAPSKQYLHDLFNSVQLKDIVKRNKIRDVDLLERIIAYVIANVGTVSYTHLDVYKRQK